MLYTNYFIESLRNSDPSMQVLFENGRSLTIGQLLQSAGKIAQALQKKGVRAGDKVIILVKPGVEFLEIMYANMMVGTLVSIIDPEMGRENFLNKLKQFGPSHAFVDSRLVLLNEHPLLKWILLSTNKLVPSFPRIKNCSLFTSGPWLPILQKHRRVAPMKQNRQEEFRFEAIDESVDFLVTYTSGTLSEPKGVVHSYFSLSNSIKHLTNLLHSNQDQVIATHLPHYVLLGVNAGIQVHLWDPRMKPEKKIDFINRNKITGLFGPPSEFLPLIDYLQLKDQQFPKCVRNIYLGSAPVYTSFLTRLVEVANEVKITCLYGMTENLLVTQQDGKEKISKNLEGDLVGKPFPNTKLHIMDDGEVAVESNQLFSGYWQMGRRNSIHLTGDLGKINEDGQLILLGRKKDMMIRGNFNIYPGLYEPTINKIKGIREAVMVGVYNADKADEEIILVVDGEKHLTADQVLKQLVRGEFSIDREALPDKIIFRKIPHSGRQQKINRKELVKQLNS